MTLAMKNLVESEKWRQAGVTTFYRKSLVLAAVCQPGISIVDLSKVMGTTRNSTRMAIGVLVDRKLLRKELHIPKKFGDPRQVKIYPTPYAKDLANIIETV
jgi:hypothetical protein